MLPLLLGKDSIDEFSDELADFRSLSKSGLCKAPIREKNLSKSSYCIQVDWQAVQSLPGSPMTSTPWPIV